MTKHLFSGLATAFLAIVAIALLPATSARATSDAWDGSTDGVWATSTNWVTDPAVVPGTGDTATFNGAGNGNTTIDLGAGVTISTLRFDTVSAALYTIGSGGAGAQTLTVNASGAVTMASTVAANELVNANLSLGTAAGANSFTITNDSTTNGLTIAGGISTTQTGAKTLTINGSGSTTLSGNITNGTGTVPLIKSGSGTATISGNNTLTGTTATLSAGTLVLGSPNALNGVTNLTVTTGASPTPTLNIATDGGDFALPLNFGTTTSLNVVSNRATTGAGINHALGAATLGGGAVNVSAGANVTSGTASISFTSVGLTAGSAQTTNIAPATGTTVSIASASIPTNNQSKTLGLDGTTTGNTVTGAITNGVGTMNIAKSNTSTWTLSGANTYTGGTTVSNGVLNMNGTHITTTGTPAYTVGSTTTIPILNIGAGAMISLTNNNNNSLNIGQAAANSKGVVNQTAGAVTLSGSIFLGQAASSTTNYGNYNLSGGTFTLNSVNRFRISQSPGAGSSAVFNVSGGTMNSNVGIALNDTAGATAGLGGAATLYVSGGTVNGTAGGTGLGIGGRRGQSEVTVGDSGTIAITNNTVLGGSVAGTPAAGDAGRVAVLNLGTGASGGTLQTQQVSQDATVGAAPVGYVNFNGGTLKAQTANATFLQGATQATVFAGGGTIDNNGVAITVGQALLAPGASSVSSISVSGATGYTGVPYVQISGGTPTTPATAVANVDGSGNVTSITVTNPGTGYSAGSPPTVTLVGGGGAAGTITPSIAAASSGGMTFQGNGTTTLSATSTYTSVTTIAGGTLVVNGSIASSSQTNVSANTTLKGVGSVGATVVAANGTLAPGNSIGTMNLGNLVLVGNLQIEYDGSAAPAIDLANVAGALNIGAGSLTFSPTGGPFTAPAYVFVNYGLLSGLPSFASVTGLPAGYSIDYAYNGGTAIALVSAVPEASALLSVGLVGLASLGYIGLRRRRPSLALARA